MTNKEEQTQTIVDFLLNRFDRNFDDKITPEEISKKFEQEGIDKATSDLLINFIMENWDSGHDGFLTFSEVVNLAKTWAEFDGDASVSHLCVSCLEQKSDIKQK